jgi:hypothetical protein
MAVRAFSSAEYTRGRHYFRDRSRRTTKHNPQPDTSVEQTNALAQSGAEITLDFTNRSRIRGRRNC